MNHLLRSAQETKQIGAEREIICTDLSLPERALSMYITCSVLECYSTACVSLQLLCTQALPCPCLPVSPSHLSFLDQTLASYLNSRLVLSWLVKAFRSWVFSSSFVQEMEERRRDSREECHEVYLGVYVSMRVYLYVYSSSKFTSRSAFFLSVVTVFHKKRERISAYTPVYVYLYSVPSMYTGQKETMAIGKNQLTLLSIVLQSGSTPLAVSLLGCRLPPYSSISRNDLQGGHGIDER